MENNSQYSVLLAELVQKLIAFLAT